MPGSSEAKRTRRYHSRTHAYETLQGVNVAGKTLAITGTTSGIGVDTAEALALAGAHVVMINRNNKASEDLKSKILQKNPNAKIDIIQCDLNSVRSARKAGEEYLARKWPIHGLILNAGVFKATFPKSNEGFEAHFGINVLAHFSLLRVLLPVVRNSAPSRIIILSSTLASRHSMKKSMNLTQKVDELCGNRVNYETLSSLAKYANSKMADMLIAFKLHRDEFHNNVSTYSVHPGDLVRTDIMRTSTPGKIFSFLSVPFTKNSSQGAATSVYCAAHPEVEKVSGRYWESCWDDEKRLEKETARDVELQEALWKRLEQLDDEICGPL